MVATRICLPQPALSTEADRTRLTTVLQENAVLKSELEVYRLKIKTLTEENRRLRQASVNIVSFYKIILCKQTERATKDYLSSRLISVGPCYKSLVI